MPGYVQRTPASVTPAYPPTPGTPGGYPPPPVDPPVYPPVPPTPPDPPPPSERQLLYVECGGGAKVILPYKAGFPVSVKASSKCYTKAGVVTAAATLDWDDVTEFADCAACLAPEYFIYTIGVGIFGEYVFTCPWNGGTPANPLTQVSVAPIPDCNNSTSPLAGYIVEPATSIYDLRITVPPATNYAYWFNASTKVLEYIVGPGGAQVPDACLYGSFVEA